MAKSKRVTRSSVDGSRTPDTGRVFQAPKQQQRPLDEALNATPAKIGGIFTEARRGLTRRLIDLGKSARNYDSRLNAVSSTRVLAIGSRPYAIKPPPGSENDADAKDIAARVARMFARVRNFPTLKQHLGHGAIETHAVLEHVYSTNVQTGEVASQPVWRHPNRFCWIEDSVEIAKLDPGVDAQPVPLSQFPDKFIVHAAVGGQSDYPWMRGALRPRILPSIAKRKGLVWWIQALERGGQAQVVATVKEGDQNLVDNILAALRNLGPDWRAVVPEGVTFTELPVHVQDGLHARFIDAMNVEDAIALLGQNLSTEVKGGSYAAAKSQERVRADYLAADLAELDETITDQWIRPLVFYNFGPGAPVPYIEHTLESRSPWTLADYQAGLCTADEYRADTGHDPEPDGRGKRYFVPAPTFGQPMPPALPSGGAAAASPFPAATSSASPTSSTSPSTTHPLRSALLRS